MDVVQKIKDLSKMAFDEGGDTRERLNAATIALRLVEQYLLVEFKQKKIEIVASELADFLKKFANPDFVEVVAVQAEKIADNFDRILGSGKRVLDRFTQNTGAGEPGRGRKRGKRKYGGR